MSRVPIRLGGALYERDRRLDARADDATGRERDAHLIVLNIVADRARARIARSMDARCATRRAASSRRRVRTSSRRTF